MVTNVPPGKKLASGIPSKFAGARSVGWRFLFGRTFPNLDAFGTAADKTQFGEHIYASNIHHTFVLQGSRGGARQPSPHHFVTKHP